MEAGTTMVMIQALMWHGWNWCLLWNIFPYIFLLPVIMSSYSILPVFKTIFASSFFFPKAIYDQVFWTCKASKLLNYSIAVQLRCVHQCVFVDQDGLRNRIGATGRNPGKIPRKILGRIPGRIRAAGRTTKKAPMNL